MHARILLLGSAVLVAVAAFSGCGGSGLVPSGGLVTLDGKPLANAIVAFAPKDGRRPATGRTDAEGRFQLTTFAANDGALTGEHSVIITACEAVNRPSSQGLGLDEGGTNQVELKWIAPQHYSSPETSGLTATVSKSQREFTFPLKSQ